MARSGRSERSVQLTLSVVLSDDASLIETLDKSERSLQRRTLGGVELVMGT